MITEKVWIPEPSGPHPVRWMDFELADGNFDRSASPVDKISEIRRTQEEKLGDNFDIKIFHAATVGSGGMPLPLLERRVDWSMQQ